MKIKKSELKQIIQEELEAVLNEPLEEDDARKLRKAKAAQHGAESGVASVTDMGKHLHTPYKDPNFVGSTADRQAKGAMTAAMPGIDASKAMGGGGYVANMGVDPRLQKTKIGAAPLPTTVDPDSDLGTRLGIKSPARTAARTARATAKDLGRSKTDQRKAAKTAKKATRQYLKRDDKFEETNQHLNQMVQEELEAVLAERNK